MTGSCLSDLKRNGLRRRRRAEPVQPKNFQTRKYFGGTVARTYNYCDEDNDSNSSQSKIEGKQSASTMPSSTALTTKVESGSPYQLSKDQVHLNSTSKLSNLTITDFESFNRTIEAYQSSQANATRISDQTKPPRRDY